MTPPYRTLTGVTAGLILLLDLGTKIWVRSSLPLYSSHPLTSFFSLTHVHNTGAAFGLFPQSNLFFIFSTLAILGGLLFSHRSLTGTSKLCAIALGAVWGGALGNLWDRLARGFVTDFLDVYWSHWHWPAFNVADSAICLGVMGLMLIGLGRPSVSRPL